MPGQQKGVPPTPSSPASGNRPPYRGSIDGSSQYRPVADLAPQVRSRQLGRPLESGLPVPESPGPIHGYGVRTAASPTGTGAGTVMWEPRRTDVSVPARPGRTVVVPVAVAPTEWRRSGASGKPPLVEKRYINIIVIPRPPRFRPQQFPLRQGVRNILYPTISNIHRISYIYS